MVWQGAKIGVLGQNGSGKSSLLRILAREDQEFKGDFQMAPEVRVGYLPQEPILDDAATVLQNIEPAVQPVKDMLKEFEEVCFHSHASTLTRYASYLIVISITG